ncbi:hypothetical protein KAR91_44135 [Candidatus Pacearchaeota archaeon]|nr:hypothetical protein [Candidatus Pacearchaeota archaeon]
MKWFEQWPEKEGLYWFYGYRYGKFFGDEKNKPELVLVNVRKIANGFMYTGDGQFMFESEVEKPHFQKVVLPELPNI